MSINKEDLELQMNNLIDRAISRKNLETQCKLLCEGCAESFSETYFGVHIFPKPVGSGVSYHTLAILASPTIGVRIVPCKAESLKKLYKED